MNENKTLTPLQVVERYHQIYVDYEKAFNKNPFSQEDLNQQLKEVVASGTDTESDEFLNKMIAIVIEKPQKREDVKNAALKFCLYADFYIMTQEEILPENIIKDYDNLPVKDGLKSFYSVKDEEFVKNEHQEITEELRGYIKAITNQVKAQDIE